MSLKTFAVRARFATALILITLVSSAFAADKTANRFAQKAEAAATFTRLPLAFEANQGQADRQVQFLSHGGGYTLFVTRQEAVFAFGKEGEVLRMKAGTNAAAKSEGLDRLPGTTDYFLGNDPSKWVKDVPQFGKVALRSVAKGVDLYYYGSNGRLEYDYVIAPGSDPRSIALLLSGNKHLKVDANGDLVIGMNKAELRFQPPVAYQEIDGKRVPVAAKYQLAGNRVSFKLGAYDQAHALVIDPVLNYSTYLGGTNSSAATAIAVDSGGLAYIAGNTATTAFPSPVPSDSCTTGTGSGQCGAKGGTQDVFVARLSAGGEAVAKLSIIGGTGTDSANGIALGSGSPAAAYVVGDTSSSDFPITTGSYQTTYGGSGDGFLFVLNSAGTTLSYSTFIGGGSADHAYGVAVNGTIAHIVGGTATGGLFSTANLFAGINGTSDGYLIKIDPSQTGTAALLWATYVGGAGDDDTRAVALLDANTAYVTGVTGSASGFVTTTLTGSPYQAALGGTSDAYVAKFDTRAGLALDGSNDPKCKSSTGKIMVTTTANHGLQVGQWVVLNAVADSGGTPNIVFVGTHRITDVPTTKTFSYSEGNCVATSNNDTGNVLAGGKATPALLYNTYVGGNLTDGGLAIALNAAGNAFIAGSTTSATGLADTSSIQNTNGGGTDGFVAELAATGSTLIYSSYLGGANADTATAVAVNPACAATCETWVAGATQSSGVSAFQTSQFGGGNLSGGSDGFVVRVNGTGTGVVFGSYLGGSGAGTAEQINAIALKPSTNQVYVAGTTDSNNLSVTSSAAQHSSPFSPSGFVAKLSGNGDIDPTLAITPNAPSANPLVASQAVVYTWGVTNATSATNMTFDMPIPQDGSANDYLNITSGTPNCVFRQGSASTGTGGVTCQLADQVALGSQTVTINATLNPAIAACAAQPCATFDLTPKVTAAESEGAGNPVTSAVTTGRVAESVALSLAGTSANSNVSGGANYKDTLDTSITYTLQVANASVDPTDVNILVTMTYPANFVVDAGTDAACTNNTPVAGKIQCNVGIVPGAGTASKNVVGHFTSVASPATLNSTLSFSTATTSTTQVYPTSANNTNFVFPVAYLGPTADLAVTTPLTITAGPVHINDPISIQAFYQSKAGSDTTTTTTLTFTFDQPFSATLPAGCTQASPGANVICALGGLAAGATGSITLTGSAPLASSAGNATMNVNADHRDRSHCHLHRR